MYQRILVPLDGSPLAEQVLPYVRILGKALQAPIELLRTFGLVPAELADPVHGRHLDQLVASFRNEAQDSLDRAQASLQGLGVPVSTSVYEGEPASYIVREAEREPGTLIAMCTHGRSGITRWVMGSVTDKVLHATTNPLLIVRATSQGNSSTDVKLSTVIVPVDGSSLAEQSLPHVVALARGLHLKVMLVRVTGSAEEYYQYSAYQRAGTIPGLGTGARSIEEFSREADARAIEYLHRVRGKLLQERVSSVEERLLHGQPAGAIVDLARETQDNLIAMTTHGHSGLERWVLGSVTDRVVRHSGDPVLVIHAAE
jgi:nucleotide-binding universal stress UspA family protein